MHGAFKYFGNDRQYDTYSDGWNHTFRGTNVEADSSLNKILVNVTQIIGRSWSKSVIIGQEKFLVNVTQVTNIQMVRS